jgi:hypothetical protein
MVVAQLATPHTRMTEKRCALVSPSYVADAVRAALPALGIVEQTSVAPLKRRS